jgi:hypothetical protein
MVNMPESVLRTGLVAATVGMRRTRVAIKPSGEAMSLTRPRDSAIMG